MLFDHDELTEELVTLFLLRLPSNIGLSKIILQGESDAIYPWINHRGLQNLLDLKCFKVEIILLFEVDNSNYSGSVPNSKRMFWVKIDGTTVLNLKSFKMIAILS